MHDDDLAVSSTEIIKKNIFKDSQIRIEKKERSNKINILEKKERSNNFFFYFFSVLGKTTNKTWTSGVGKTNPLHTLHGQLNEREGKTWWLFLL